MAATTTSSPFTRAVVSAIQNVYPEHLADKSFDNTGLLLEAPFDPKRTVQKNSVLLANDVTGAVVDEAIERRDSVIVAYHPIIFHGLKSLTLANSQQKSLLRCAAAGISVYCPHTAVDCVEGGNADWLGDIVTGEIKADYVAQNNSNASAPMGQDYKLQHFPSSHDARHDSITLASLPHSRRPIQGPSQPDSKHKNAGIGRLITFEQPRPLSEIITTLATYLGSPPSMQVATPQTHPDPGAQPITRIAICAGSGGSVFGKLKEPVDLLITGELVHHEVLAAIEQGTSAICLNHSNSERAYLGAVMKGLLEKEIGEVWGKAREEKGKEGGEGWEEEGISVDVSVRDRDPFSYAVRSA